MKTMLARLVTIILVGALCVALLLYFTGKNLIQPGGVDASDVLITNANIVDVNTGTIHHARTLVIESGIVTAIVPSADRSEAGAGHIIDANGRYIIPGLWDMHTHVTLRTFEHSALPATLTQGVFYVREMIGDCHGTGCEYYRTTEEVLRLQAALDSGAIFGPKIMSFGSFAVNGRKGVEGGAEALNGRHYLAPDNSDDVTRLIDHARIRGYDFIKTYNSMPAPVYLSLVSAANNAGLSVQGHIPRSVSLTEAIDAGQRSIEHARYPLIGCSRATEAFRTAYRKYIDGESTEPVSLSAWYPILLEEEDSTACNLLLKQWAASDTYYVPTHITREAEFLISRRDFLNDPRIKYLPENVIEDVWEEEAAAYQDKFSNSPDTEIHYQAFYQQGLRLTGRAHKAGVKIMAGTDIGDILIYPGFSLHDELGKLVEAGLSPAEALRAATIVPATFYGLDQSMGSIDIGKKADLVMLDANPLENIAHSAKIAGILFEQRFYDQTELNRTLAEIADRTSGAGLYLHSGWDMLTTSLKYL